MSNEQIDLFSYSMPRFKIDKPIRLIELFAGIGSQAKALERLGADYEHYKVVEWDVHCIRSYNAIHGTNFGTSDITKVHASDLEIVERESYCYILTYSFPCQDLSLAGNRAGMVKGSGTRSGLLWEVERILDECEGNLPQVLLMENVPQVIGKKNIKDFQMWRRKLESLGYTNYVQLLNSKQVGYPEPIPQNRNRCFMVSILGQYHYTFPRKQKLKLKLKDMLEDKVDEKYYLSDKLIKCFLSDGTGKYPRGERFMQNINRSNQNIGNSITTLAGNRATDNFVVSKVGNYSPSNHNASSIVNTEGLAPTVMENHGTVTAICENQERERVIPIKNNNSKGYTLAKSGDGIDISSRMKHHRGTVQKDMAQTIKTQCEVGIIDEGISS